MKLPVVAVVLALAGCGGFATGAIAPTKRPTAASAVPTDQGRDQLEVLLDRRSALSNMIAETDPGAPGRAELVARRAVVNAELRALEEQAFIDVWRGRLTTKGPTP